MSRRRPIGLKDRQRVLELSNQRLSVRQIAERMNISCEAAERTLARGLRRCGRCARTIGTGRVCSVCALSAKAAFGERLRAFRSAASMSQLQLAMNIGVGCARVRHWEKGQRPPAEHELEMLAEALELTVQQLTGIAQ